MKHYKNALKIFVHSVTMTEELHLCDKTKNVQRNLEWQTRKKNVIKWQWSSKRRATQTETQANCLLFKYLWCKLDARVWMAKLRLLPQSFFVKTCHKDFGTHRARIIQASWFFEGLLFFQLKLLLQFELI